MCLAHCLSRAVFTIRTRGVCNSKAAGILPVLRGLLPSQADWDVRENEREFLDVGMNIILVSLLECLSGQWDS